ncbi:hypothetical protein BDV28DRAFT_141416 [Aspergillus coremiiformis]|uniref:Uncharacterized protein n=1 Tax=Aspergillus coremiiformis TaxID=138285 RepID=A0A5N6YV86_9EURO|nr:hypothetical protein BDV28DRAFT_141416 [Aspergillus coremiiformis]
MSRNWIPALVAIGVGVFSGYYTFQPVLKELQTEETSSRRSFQPKERTHTPNMKEGLDVPVKPDTEPTQGGDAK